jgi:tRNA threonylcarbamoyladenosine biosynthesis protein TsaB
VTSGISLALDAAGGDASIAVLSDGLVIAARDVVMRSADEERFFPALLQLLDDAQLSLASLDRIIVGAGPGSFTALRVIGATAKGIAQGRGIPLFAVPSLALMAAASPASAEPGSRVLATLDALRGERYAALVVTGADGNIDRVEQLGVIAVADVTARATALGAQLVGTGPDSPAVAHANGAARCLALVAASGPVDLASWEPMYGRLAEAQVKWEAAHGRPLA